VFAQASPNTTAFARDSLRKHRQITTPFAREPLPRIAKPHRICPSLFAQPSRRRDRICPSCHREAQGTTTRWLPVCLRSPPLLHLPMLLIPPPSEIAPVCTALADHLARRSTSDHGGHQQRPSKAAPQHPGQGHQPPGHEPVQHHADALQPKQA
jgi:hypothetical protein